MAEPAVPLREARDSLHSLALYLLEMAARAQLAGSATMVVQTSSFVSMAQTTFKAVIALESAMGTTGTPEPNPPPSSAGGGKPGGGMDPTEYLAKLTEVVRKQTEEVQRKSFEDLQKLYEQQNKPPAPSPPADPPPPPTPVPG